HPCGRHRASWPPSPSSDNRSGLPVQGAEDRSTWIDVGHPIPPWGRMREEGSREGPRRRARLATPFASSFALASVQFLAHGLELLPLGQGHFRDRVSILERRGR